MVESALDKALANAERLLVAAKSAAGSASADIGRQLAASSNWESRESAKLVPHIEQYRRGYRGWSYVAINAISRRCASQPIRLARAKKPSRRGLKAFSAPYGSKAFVENLEPIESHRFLDCFHAPNRIMVGQSLMVSTIASLEITGESHWWLSPADDGTPEIIPLPSHWIRPADNLRSRWILRPWYSSEEWTVDGDSIGYFNLPDPSDPFMSRSPLASQANAVETDDSIQLAQNAAFRNGIMPKLAVMIGDPLTHPGDNRLISSPVMLDRDQRGVIINAIMDRWGGANKAGSPIICDALIRDIKPISQSPAEMDFLNSGKSVKTRIVQAFGVNPLIFGEIEGANRAQAVVAEESFCRNVVNPLLELLSQGVTRWVLPAFAEQKDEGLVAWFEPARAQDDETSLKEWQLGLQYGTVSPNEYRQFLGLPSIKGGDTPRIPANMLAMGD